MAPGEKPGAERREGIKPAIGRPGILALLEPSTGVPCLPEGSSARLSSGGLLPEGKL